MSGHALLPTKPLRELVKLNQMVVQFRRRMQVLTMAVTAPWVVGVVVNSRPRINNNIMTVVRMLKLTSTNRWLPPKPFEYGLKFNSIQVIAHGDSPGTFAPPRSHAPRLGMGLGRTGPGVTIQNGDLHQRKPGGRIRLSGINQIKLTTLLENCNRQ
jgi:hypothetical protein